MSAKRAADSSASSSSKRPATRPASGDAIDVHAPEVVRAKPGWAWRRYVDPTAMPFLTMAPGAVPGPMRKAVFDYKKRLQDRMNTSPEQTAYDARCNLHTELSENNYDHCTKAYCCATCPNIAGYTIEKGDVSYSVRLGRFVPNPFYPTERVGFCRDCTAIDSEWKRVGKMGLMSIVAIDNLDYDMERIRKKGPFDVLPSYAFRPDDDDYFGIGFETYVGTTMISVGKTFVINNNGVGTEYIATSSPRLIHAHDLMYWWFEADKVKPSSE